MPPEEQVSVDQTAEQDLSAGFAKAQEAKSVSSPEAPTQTQEPIEQQPKPEEKPAAPKEEPAAAPDPVAELRTALSERDKTIDGLKGEIRKNFGQIGEVTRALNAINERLAARPSGSPRKITAEMLKRVEEEIPGLGDALAQDLAAILEPVEQAQAQAQATGQPFDAEKFFTETIAPALAQLEARTNEAAEMRLIKREHRDFDTVMKDPEFSKWLSTLPADKQTQYRESEDGLVVIDAVTEFKAAREKAAKEAKAKQNRLEAAVTPKGQPRPPGSEAKDPDADLAAGFKRVAGRRL